MSIRSRSVCLLPLALLIAATGCATKKHVKLQVEPLEKRVGGLEAKDRQTDATIGNLEKGISAADERARAADSRAAEAGKDAARANDRAGQVGEQADAANRLAGNAKSLAEQGLSKNTEMEQRLAALDSFQLVTTQNVLFGVSQFLLTTDAKKTLDDTVAQIQGQKRYVIEVQGFTDKTGRADANLELSRKRANEVVRYLTVQHKIPLYRIYTQGAGSLVPVANDKTRDGRKQNRRVEIRVYSADTEGKKVTASIGGR